MTLSQRQHMQVTTKLIIGCLQPIIGQKCPGKSKLTLTPVTSVKNPNPEDMLQLDSYNLYQFPHNHLRLLPWTLFQNYLNQMDMTISWS